MSSLAFRNVDASIDDPIESWPYEALATVIDRGLVADWQPVLAEIRRRPWGRTASRAEHIIANQDVVGVARFFELALERARATAEATDRAAVVEQIRGALARSGMTAKDFARLVGTSPSRFSTYLSGKVVPSAAMAERIERGGTYPG